MAPPIGFLDIPREIRDEIYSLLLHSGRLPNPVFTSSGAVVESGGLNDVHLAILRTNRQIGNEAREVFYKINRLVRVSILLETADMTDLLATFASKYLPPPMIRRLEPAIEPFKGFVMNYTITRIKSLANHTGQIEFVMLHRDLHLLSLCLEHANIRADTFGSVTKHSITLNNPFEDTDKSYPNMDQQKMLLSPFAKLRGFHNVQIKGAVNSSLASRIMVQAREKTQFDEDAILKTLRYQESLGHEYLRQKKLDKSCEAWAGACKTIESLAMTDSLFFDSLTLPATPWIDQLQELFCELNQKLWATVIRIMESNLIDHNLVHDLADQAIRGLSHTLWRGAFFNANWKPSTEQKADLLRQKAIVYRLTQDFRQALREVKQAGAFCPDDPDVRAERFAVECQLVWMNFTIGQPD